MNMQAMLKQAQNLQKEMIKSQNEIANMSFTAEKDLVKVELGGDKKIKKIEINKDNNLDKDDIEMVEDMLLVALNDALGQIDKVTEEKMGKYTRGMPGLF